MGNHLKENDFDNAVILRASVPIRLTLTAKKKIILLKTAEVTSEAIQELEF